MSGWRKKSFLVGLAFVLLFIFSGCAGKEKTDQEKLQEAFQDALKEAANNASNNEEASTEAAEPPTVESKLSEISNSITTDFWNEGFVDISWYIASGTSSTGEKLDIDFTIDRLGKAMEKKAKYDAYIQGLDVKYDDIKPVWSKLSNEIDSLYKKVKENPPAAIDPDYEFDTGLFEQYSDAFSKDVEALNSN